jgi:hypothetical protein
MVVYVEHGGCRGRSSPAHLGAPHEGRYKLVAVGAAIALMMPGAEAPEATH